MPLPLRLLFVLLCLGYAHGAAHVHKGRAISITNVTGPAVHGEGSHWDPINQQLYFVDIHDKYVHRYDPATGIDYKLLLPTNVTLVIPERDNPNNFLITLNHTLTVLTWDGTSSEYSLQDIVTVEEDKPDNRFNDGKADVVGRIWAGTMGPEPVVGEVTPDQASLYKVDVDSTEAQVMISPVSVSNGITWDDDVMYYVDSPSNVIAAYDFDATQGTIANRRIVFNITEAGIEGTMDGMNIDSDGNLWVALFNGWHVLQVDPRTGEALQTVELPVQRVTSVAWGGPAMDELYVTTSRSGLNEDEIAQQPLAGSLFHITGLGVTGATAFTAVRAL